MASPTQLPQLENWLHQLAISSVPLQQLDTNLLPQRFASGCLCEYKGLRFLLTAGHAMLKQGDWAVAVRYVPDYGTELYRLGNMTMLERLRLGMPMLDVDFAFTAVPQDLCPMWEAFDPNTLKLTNQEPRTVHRLNFEGIPKRGCWYGFCGHTKHVFEDHSWLGFKQPVLDAQAAIVSAIEYVSTEDDMHVFKIAGGHPGHNVFYGCSGAPIIDGQGNVVALVSGGDVERGIVRGVSLHQYRSALDVEVLLEAERTQLLKQSVPACLE